MRELRDPELLEHYIRKYHSFVFQNCDNPPQSRCSRDSSPKGRAKALRAKKIFWTV